MTNDKPLVYACSGCSNVAQLANDIAVQMDRRGDTEMSCIAGVGGDVARLVRVAKSGRDILAIDGCPLACVKHTLARQQVQPSWHVELSRHGVKKRYREACTQEEQRAMEAVVYQLLALPKPN
jgi:uncharacterized metal-binding protein